MKQYLDLLQNILDNGVEKESGRANMPNTIGISHGVIKMDMTDGFPLLTTKKMYLKGIIHELLWILSGDTNIKYLVDNNVNIWSGDAYRWYQKHLHDMITPDKSIDYLTMNEFIEKIKEGDLLQLTKNSFWKDPNFLKNTLSTYKLGDLGKVYGYQWRNQNGVDQVRDVIEGLRDNPYSRYHIIDAWNKKDFKEMALPPCHLLYQFIVRPLTFKERRDLARTYASENNKIPLAIDAHGFTGIPKYMEVIDNTGWNIPKFYLDLNMYQRSCDTFLGVPFNIASMSILLMIFAKVSNMIPGVSTWIGGDTHLYVDHISVVKEQLSREPKKLPELIIKKDLKTLENILSLTIDNFELVGYESYDKLVGELFTGIKK